MNFETEQCIRGVSVEAYEAMFFGEALNIALCEALAMQRTLVRRSDQGGWLERTVKIHPRRRLPAGIAALIDPDRIAYTETMRYRWGSFTGHWRIVPGMFADKVESHGEVAFAAHPDGVVRRVTGEVRVRILGVGGMVERFIVDDIHRSFARAAELTELWLQSQRSQTAAVRQAGRKR